MKIYSNMLLSLVTTWRESSYSYKLNTGLLEKSGSDQQLISPKSIMVNKKTVDENKENHHNWCTTEFTNIHESQFFVVHCLIRNFLLKSGKEFSHYRVCPCVLVINSPCYSQEIFKNVIHWNKRSLHFYFTHSCLSCRNFCQ